MCCLPPRPEGTKIAVLTARRGGPQPVEIMNADGTGQKQLYYGYATGWQEMQPHWSPDGTKILFVWYSYSDARIYTMETVGWPVTRLLVNSVAKEFDPSWSPDGSRIVFSSTRDGKYAVYRAHYNGWGQTRISPLTSSNSQSSWGR